MRRPNVVTIGGGTGSFMLLSGLKKYPINLSAIVSMADDGGSTGVLRDELGVLPPGDVRQCLVALSDSSEVLRNLMNYRFESGGLKGHSFGNLFLSALEKTSGSFLLGIEEASKILNVGGEVIPVTASDIQLCMELKDGKRLAGEEAINHSPDIQNIGVRKNYLQPRARVNPKAVKAISEADAIIIGPGNHYCSVIPNFLVPGIPEALRKSEARIIYVSNLVNKKNHTEGFTVDDYVREMNRLIGSERIGYAIYNCREPDRKLLERYRRRRDLLVDLGSGRKRNYRVIKADIVSSDPVRISRSDRIGQQRSFIRHDSAKLARAIMRIINK